MFLPNKLDFQSSSYTDLSVILSSSRFHDIDFRVDRTWCKTASMQYLSWHGNKEKDNDGNLEIVIIQKDPYSFMSFIIIHDLKSIN